MSEQAGGAVGGAADLAKTAVDVAAGTAETTLDATVGTIRGAFQLLIDAQQKLLDAALGKEPGAE